MMCSRQVPMMCMLLRKLALTPADFDFEKRTVTINKSYQRLNGRDVITTPKTEKSNRTITIPKFLAEEMQDYLKMLYDVGENDRMFIITKSYLHNEMNRGSKEAGVSVSEYTIFVTATSATLLT